jgi:lysophospholipase L1-like esterase
MSWRDIAWDDQALALRGAIDVRRTAGGIRPHRLPAWSDAQMPDPALQLMAAMPSGVRLALRSNTRRLRLACEAIGFQMAGTPRRAVAFDLVIDGALHARHFDEAGPTLVIGPPPAIKLAGGTHCEIVFDDLPDGDKLIELWLPQSAQIELHSLAIDAAASLAAAPAGRHWIHYGSSISHAMDAAGPSETWPALAARAAGISLTLLGFAGQCLLDSVVARTIAAMPADLISLKIGINIVNHDAMRERAFIAAVHGFIDTIRDRQPDVPILIISPIFCGLAETAPGPTIRSDGNGIVGFHHVSRPPELGTGALTLVRIRELLAAIVDCRSDVKLHYLSGLDLFGAADASHLHDGLHPDAEGHRLIGARFTKLSEPMQRLLAC